MSALYLRFNKDISFWKKVKLYFKKRYWSILPIANSHSIKISFGKNDKYFDEGYYPAKIVLKHICIYVKKYKIIDMDVYYLLVSLFKYLDSKNIKLEELQIVIKNINGYNYLFLKDVVSKNYLYIGILEILFNVLYRTENFTKEPDMFILFPQKMVLIFKNGDTIIINNNKYRYYKQDTNLIRNLKRVKRYMVKTYKISMRISYEFPELNIKERLDQNEDTLKENLKGIDLLIDFLKNIGSDRSKLAKSMFGRLNLLYKNVYYSYLQMYFLLNFLQLRRGEIRNHYKIDNQIDSNSEL